MGQEEGDGHRDEHEARGEARADPCGQTQPSGEFGQRGRPCEHRWQGESQRRQDSHPRQPGRRPISAHVPPLVFPLWLPRLGLEPSLPPGQFWRPRAPKLWGLPISICRTSYTRRRFRYTVRGSRYTALSSRRAQPKLGLEPSLPPGQFWRPRAPKLWGSQLPYSDLDGNARGIRRPWPQRDVSDLLVVANLQKQTLILANAADAVHEPRSEE